MLIPNKYDGYSRDGRRLYYFGGDDDGGGAAAAAPTTTNYIQQTQQGFAPEVAPYAQTLLGQAAALTDTEMNPYMQYQGERIAQFSPLQNQSYQNMALMQTQPQLQDATALAGQAGLGALNTQYTFDPSNFNKAFSAATTRDAQGNVTGNTMMNPYMQNVVERQQQDAARQAAIAGQAQQAQAARSGAFGGSGDYLMRGQAAGNLARQKGDIQAQGLNAAYNQAMQQYNQQYQQNAQQQQYGAGLGLQGLQMANQSAQNLGNLGNLQYQQNMGINQMQNQYGLQQQAQMQQDLTNKYQDYLNAQNYPYKQLGFMSDMVRGLPLGQQSTQAMYPQAPPPSAIQSVGAAGMGLYGASKLFGKEGGLMTSYAEGGVTSAQNVESILPKLSDQQLKQARKTVLARRDIEQAQMIDAEMAQRASIRGGLGGAFNQIPERRQETMMAANGGIVAFAGNKSSVVEDDEDDEETGPSMSDLLASSEGNPAAYKQITSMFPQLMANVASAKYKPMTDEAYNAAITARRKALEDGAGPSPYADYESKLAGMEAEDAKGLEQAKGLAAIAAIPAMLEGNNAIRGIGRASGKFAGAYGQALQADKAQKRAMMSMRMNLADAQRKERMGLTRDSISAADQARRDHDAAQQFGIKKAQALASVAGKFATATKPVGGGGAGGPKPLKINEQLAEAEVAFENDPSDANKKRVTALRRAVSQTKLTDFGPTRAGLAGESIEAPEDREAKAALNKFSTSKLNKREWQAMIDKHGSEDAARTAFINNYKVTGKAPAPAKVDPTNSAPRGKNISPSGGQKTMSMDDVKATAAARKISEADVIDAAKKAGFIIK